MKITKETLLDDYPLTPSGYGLTCVLSNGIEIFVSNRATLYGYIQRGYYKQDDIIDWAYIKCFGGYYINE